jgi:hypothetical protein
MSRSTRCSISFKLAGENCEALLTEHIHNVRVSNLELDEGVVVRILQAAAYPAQHGARL